MAETTTGIFGPSRQAHTVEAQGRAFAPLRPGIMILGETGAGKGVLAAQIHKWSGRPGRLVTVTGGMLDGELWQDALFGHVRGAYTGAHEKRQGAFASARDGTIFLDEYHQWPAAVQAGLLRPLGDGRFGHPGEDRDMVMTARVLVAGPVEPATLVDQGKLLPDLAFRLPALKITVPPLRERRVDILHVAFGALRQLAVDFQLAGTPRFSPTALRALLVHSWPGNFRDLEASLSLAASRLCLSRGVVIEPGHLDLPTPPSLVAGGNLDASDAIAVARWLLAHCNGNKSEAAALLGVDRHTIDRWLRLDEAAPAPSGARERSPRPDPESRSRTVPAKTNHDKHLGNGARVFSTATRKC